MKEAEDGEMEKTQRLGMFISKYQLDRITDITSPKHLQTNSKQTPSHADTVVSRCSALDQGLIRKQEVDGMRG